MMYALVAALCALSMLSGWFYGATSAHKQLQACQERTHRYAETIDKLDATK